MQVKPLLQSVSPANFLEDYLYACGVEDVDEYMKPSASHQDKPSLYKNIDEACKTIHNAIEENYSIGILCDEDQDGISSTTIVYLFLRVLGADPCVFFHSISKAHGLNKTSKDTVFDDIIAWKPQLLIIPDASADEYCCKELRQHRCDVIFFDHHLYDFDSNPYALIVNCLQQSETNQCASGALVSFKFCQRYSELYKIKCPDYTDLVAISLVSDVMNLSNMENRQYIYNWLQEYEQFVNF